MRSLTVSDWTSIQTMMPSYMISSETQGKLTGPWNIGHSDLQKYEVTCSVELNKYSKYDAYLLNRARDARQNQWTMKNRSQWSTNSMKSLTLSDWSIVQNMMPFYLISSEIQGKITGSWNVCHNDIQKLWGHSQCETKQERKVWCLFIR